MSQPKVEVKEKYTGPVKYMTKDGAGGVYYFVMDSVGSNAKPVRQEVYDSLKDYKEVKYEDFNK